METITPEEKIFYMLEDIYQSFIDYNSRVIGSRYEELNLNEIHSIDFIGKNDFPNVTRIASHLKITRGAVTKITTKLIRLGYLELFQEEHNRKEKYFRLAPKGQELYKRHEVFHKETLQRDTEMYKKFSRNELDVVSGFLQLVQNNFNQKLKIGDSEYYDKD